MQRLSPILFIAASLLVACASERVPPDDVEPDPDVVLLSPTDHLVRASMVLRGIRPSAEELRSVADDPTLVEPLVREYVQSPEFGTTMRDLHNETLLLRLARVLPQLPPLDQYTLAELNHSIQEAPLRLIEHVIVNDLPYTEILTADYTLANHVGAQAWFGLQSYDFGGDEWQVLSWSDGRPAAGILSTNALFFTHESNGANYHRGRANLIATALLCSDFLTRPIEIDGTLDLSDPDVVSNAVVNEAACASCHQVLDPLASFLWGFRPRLQNQQVEAYPVPMYGTFLEDRWMETTGRAPAYYGADGDRLDDLGALIADDPRFSLCTARRFFSYFGEVDVSDVPLDVAAELQRELIDSGFDAKELAVATVMHDAFRVSHATTDEAAADLVGLEKVRPSQLGSMITGLTGFRWETDIDILNFGRADLMRDDIVGFRVLGGGINSNTVKLPSHTVNTTTSLLLRTIAFEAAGYAVEEDFSIADKTQRHVLTLVDDTDTDEAAIRTQLAELHLAFYAEFVDADSVEVDESYDVFDDTLGRTDDVRHAWKTTLTAMLQDVRIAYY